MRSRLKRLDAATPRRSGRRLAQTLARTISAGSDRTQVRGRTGWFAFAAFRKSASTFFCCISSLCRSRSSSLHARLTSRLYCRICSCSVSCLLAMLPIFNVCSCCAHDKYRTGRASANKMTRSDVRQAPRPLLRARPLTSVFLCCVLRIWSAYTGPRRATYDSSGSHLLPLSLNRPDPTAGTAGMSVGVLG